ncbi:Cupin domain-containing protein [Trichococcus patagoniensis]|uniref:Cupin domain-containing protein n=1 Tax=Trichococcus patagoniensis TaxID=382641 RepID=A0A2T5ICN2_9LACT|nr:cupin domain-containing protein [Trichococcus patagoniensis]PTQ81597.1 Cupin domain-containing protein [Trichococcus patagoniensis]
METGGSIFEMEAIEVASSNQSKIKERLFKLDEIAQFDSEAGKKTIFYETEFMAGAVWCLEPGQKVVNHSHSTSDDIWICMQGTGTFYPGFGEAVEITKGDIIFSERGQQHGMVNTGKEQFVFVGVAGPMPMDFISHEE